jgi:hypothetical protein
MVYINLVQNDMLDALDQVDSSKTVYSIAPLEGQSGQEVQRQRRSARLAAAVAKQVLGGDLTAADTRAPSKTEVGDKVAKESEAGLDHSPEQVPTQAIAALPWRKLRPSPNRIWPSCPASPTERRAQTRRNRYLPSALGK